MNQDPAEFGSRLKTQRESRSLSIVDIARTTKIPEQQIQKLEHGRFDDLPADVFVRGFLRSYCRAVGLDVDDTLRAYGTLGRRPSRMMTLTRPMLAHGSVDGSATSEMSIAGHADGVTPVVATPAAAKPAPVPVVEETTPEPSLLSAISQAGRGISRTSLTLAVIILVIVATLTLSLLLRRPSHVGDGFSVAPAPTDTLA
jgi:Helix-turn-helix domain